MLSQSFNAKTMLNFFFHADFMEYLNSEFYVFLRKELSTKFKGKKI